MFLFIALEFIYAQSPESMKGLLTGLFYLILGLTSILSSGVYYAYSHTLEDRRLAPFHGVFTLIQVIQHNLTTQLMFCESISQL